MTLSTGVTRGGLILASGAGDGFWPEIVLTDRTHAPRFQPDQPLQVIDEIDQTDLGFGSLEPDRADEQAHAVLLLSKDVLDMRADRRFAGIGTARALRHQPAFGFLRWMQETKPLRSMSWPPWSVLNIYPSWCPGVTDRGESSSDKAAIRCYALRRWRQAMAKLAVLLAGKGWSASVSSMVGCILKSLIDRGCGSALNKAPVFGAHCLIE